MALTHTPTCKTDTIAADFKLPDTENQMRSLAECRGENATLIMFICNHCPYVQGVLPRLIEDCHTLQKWGISSIAIMPNDTINYPQDGMQHMRTLAEEMQFPFPYLLDESQQIARAYDAVCTPDFFGYDRNLKLQYRGRLDAYGKDPAPATAERILVNAMKEIAEKGHYSGEQHPSMGCSIKWKDGM